MTIPGASDGQQPRAIVTGDLLGDGVATELASAGCEVIRGPRPVARRLDPVLPPDSWPDVLASTDVIVVSPRDRCPGDMIASAPRLRGIVSTVIGVDTIDIAAADERGLLVAYGAMPENYIGVAEATIMFIAALSLELRRKQALLDRTGPPTSMIGHMVEGRIVGLVGFGRIGRAVAERLAGWGVRILAADPLAGPATDLAVELVGLPTLLEQSDFVSMHATLGESNRNLIGAAELALMKPTAYLINTARGGLVDEQALVAALEGGHIAGAALDVFAEEPLAADSPLRRLDNVLLTPHMIGHSEELLKAIWSVGAENALRILRGETPRYVKNEATLPAWRERLARLQESAG